MTADNTAPQARMEQNGIAACPPNGTPLSVGGVILMLAAGMSLLGVVMVFSASGSLERPWPRTNLLQFAPLRQGVFAVFGLALMWVTYGIGYRWMRWRGAEVPAAAPHDGAGLRFQPAVAVMAVSLICLIAVLIPGVGIERHGARRWLQFGPGQYGIGFQPSELAKIAVVVLLSAWLAHRQTRMRSFSKGIVPPVILIAVVAGLVVVEDLGTAALIVVVGGMLTLAAGARWWHAACLALPGILAFVGMIFARPYRLERIMSFMDIWKDPQGRGYHAIQSLVAIASGDWKGVGLGAGTQKYGYLPEAKTDFIYAIICEEMGIIGGLAVLGLFTCLVILGGRVALRAPDSQGKLLALGVTLMIALQAVLNIAVVTVSVPTKGISLPLISSGGSGVVFYSIAIGLLAAVSRRTACAPP